MRVKVRLFAGLRERAGWTEQDVDGVTRVEDVWPVLSLGPEPEQPLIPKKPMTMKATIIQNDR